MFLERYFLQVHSVNKALLQKGTNTRLLLCRLLPAASGNNTNCSVSGSFANTGIVLQIY
ncbi:hypothetical protein Nmel_007034 [Mimus melanotis]